MTSIHWGGVPIDGGERFGEDSIFVKNFFNKYIGDSRAECEILFNLEAMPYIPRNHPAMAYRGNELTRTKFFFQDSADPDDTLVYKYTGIQWRSTELYVHLRDWKNKNVCDMVDAFNANLSVNGESPGYNHVIGTKYKNERDGIGLHSDKTQSWTPESNVAILSFGADRTFTITNLEGKVEQTFELSCGDLFLLGWKDNMKYKHGILAAKEPCGPRVSLCFRNIEEIWGKEQLTAKIEASDRARDQRAARKAEKKAAAEAEKAAAEVYVYAAQLADGVGVNLFL